MDISNFDTSIFAAPFMLMCIAIAAIAWFAMIVGSLQLSLGLTTERAPSYLRCLIMLILIMIGNITVFVGMHLILGPQPWYIVGAYQTFVQIGLMMIVARCNPFSAFFATLFHSAFSSMGTLVIALVFFVVCGSALSGMKERQQPPGYATTTETTSDSWFKGFETGRSQPGFRRKRIRFTRNPFTH